METLGSKRVYANPWITVREDTVRGPSGSTDSHGVVDAPDGALINAADDDRLCLVEQYRYPVGGRRWEFPSGSADRRDVDPATSAARELREETGLRAASWTQLGTLDMAPEVFSHRSRVFLATGLTHGVPRRELAEHDMRTAWFSRAEVERMIVDGELTDAKSIASYTLLLLHERRDRG